MESCAEHGHEVACDYSACLEAALFGAVGIYPVAHGYAVGSFVHEFMHWSYKLHESGFVGSHGGCPYDPVGLGIGVAVV